MVFCGSCSYIIICKPLCKKFGKRGVIPIELSLGRHSFFNKSKDLNIHFIPFLSYVSLLFLNIDKLYFLKILYMKLDRVKTLFLM